MTARLLAEPFKLKAAKRCKIYITLLFDRWDEHLYEFNLGSDPYDRSKIYSMRMVPEGFEDSEKPAGFGNDTTIDDLKSTVDRAFGYAFDFGDDWQHQI